MTVSSDILIGLVRSAREGTTAQVLSAVVDALHDGAGYKMVAISVYRPAWDDYQAVVVTGSQEARDALLYTCLSREDVEHVLGGGEERLPGVHFLPAETSRFATLENTFTPDLPATDDPDAWKAEDALLVKLFDDHGLPLGLLSVDEPLSGKRPFDADLEALRAVAQHAEQALEIAARNERQASLERMMTSWLNAAPALTQSATHEALGTAIFDTLVSNFGFERLALYGRDDAGELTLRGHRGWGDPGAALAQVLRTHEVDALLAPDRAQAGCWLVDARTLFPAAPEGVRSHRNGRGPGGWSDQCLLIPVREEDGGLRLVMVLEDPSDHAIPGENRRRIMRLMIEQAGSVEELISIRQDLAYLASHDPLTGLRNRRDLHELLGSHVEVALLVCDIDHFKAINDRYGHGTGDRVLERFGELLRSLARESDVPIRLGGEEFCMLLPRTDRQGALEAAERLRTEVQKRMVDLVSEPVTVSIGVASSSDVAGDGQALLAAADRRMYAAKAAGRNRAWCDDGAV